MKINRSIGFLIILIGFLIPFYKDGDFYGFGGYVDKSWENILMSLVLFITGFNIVKGQPVLGIENYLKPEIMDICK